MPRKKPYTMDVDHRLLLHTCKPLLNSRNAAVSLSMHWVFKYILSDQSVILFPVGACFLIYTTGGAIVANSEGGVPQTT